MEKTIKILLFDSLAGRGFAYGKGENDVPEHLAAEWVKIGLAEYVNPPQTKTAQGPHQTAEKAISAQAKTTEKR